jgi:toxin CptA
MLSAALLLIVLVGFANQRGSTCAVSAADEIVREGRFNRIAGFVLAAAVSAAVMALAGASPRLTASASLAAALGGAIAAAGASLNGRCAMGTVASLSRGRLDRLGTLAGFLVGVWLADNAPGLAPAPVVMGMPPHSLALAALAMVVTVAAWHFSRREDLPAPHWMMLTGLLNASLLLLRPDWTYTGGLTALARGQMDAPQRFALDVMLILVGGLAAASIDRTLRLRIATPRAWMRSLAGGALMGVGSALVPGGNDTMLLIGVPLLFPGLLIAYAAFWAAILPLRWMRMRWT